MLSTADKILVLKSVSIFSTVKLDLEAQGLITRVPGVRPPAPQASPVSNLVREPLRRSQRMLPALSTRC